MGHLLMLYSILCCIHEQWYVSTPGDWVLFLTDLLIAAVFPIVASFVKPDSTPLKIVSISLCVVQIIKSIWTLYKMLHQKLTDKTLYQDVLKSLKEVKTQLAESEQSRQEEEARRMRDNRKLRRQTAESEARRKRDNKKLRRQVAKMEARLRQQATESEVRLQQQIKFSEERTERMTSNQVRFICDTLAPTVSSSMVRSQPHQDLP
jgi:hypothetical protein